MSASPLDEHAVFSVAVRIPDCEAREAYLAQVCGADVALFDRVQSLLRAAQRQCSFLESPPPGVDVTVAAARPGNLEGTLIGRYRILQELGEGGFGVVYMAEQLEPIRRKVALKIVKPGMDSREVIARFEAERQALALMEHPNIARVLDGGQTDNGHPYFVMELVRGVTITRYADDNNLSTHQRLQLFAQVCHAVQHAHQKGIIHRDIKPSNVLVTLHDGRPVPKVIDFGVAKAVSQQLTEKTLFTRYGQVIGTPQYMSPEQAEMSGLDVDTRSDIYSLGVLVYELLVGRTPFETQQLHGVGLDELRRVIREQEPSAPSYVIRTLDINTATTVATHRSCERQALCRQLRGDLDWITMRALEKDRNRRYETAIAMANDVRRYLNNEPIEAGPPTLSYRAWKAWRRNRAAFAAGGAVALALLVGLAVAVAGWSRTWAALAGEQEARQEADNAKEEAVVQREEAEQQRNRAVTEAENSQRTLELVLQILSNSGTNPETGQEFTVTQALDDLARRLDDGLDLQTGTAAELHLGLARAFLASGQRARSITHFRRAYETGQEAWPADDKRLADARREAAYLSESIDELQAAVAADRQLTDQTTIVKSLALLGSVAYEKGRLEVAEAALREAVDKCPQDGGDLQFVEIPHLVLADLLAAKGDATVAQQQKSAGIDLAKRRFWDYDQPWYRLAGSLVESGRAQAANRAFEMAQGCRRTVNAFWIKQFGHFLREKSAFVLADRAFAWGVQVAIETGDQNERLWNLLNRSRLRFHARDLAGAEQYYKEAVAIVREGPDAPLDVQLWAFNEYGRLLAVSGRGNDASQQFADCLHLLQAHPDYLRGSMEDVYRLICHVMMGRIQDVHDEVEQYVKNNANEGEFRNSLFVIARINKPDFTVEGIDSVEQFENFCRGIRAYETAFIQAYEDKYVDWMKNRQELDRAAQFLADVLKKRDAQFDAHNPERAWTRVRLARVLLQLGREPEQIKQLMTEAIPILQSNPMVPPEHIAELHAMLADRDAPASRR